MNRWLISQAIPNRNIDLLLRANLAPDDRAVRPWQDWLRMRSVDDAAWQELRLLAPLARRIATLDPYSPLRPRLEGLAKAHWTKTQLILRDCASALDALRSAGIDCLLFKGAANYAEGLTPATRRIMCEVDILVPPEAVVAASDRLCEAGWSADGQPPEIVRHDVQRRISTNFRNGEFGEIDLHRSVFHFSRRAPELDASLWERARPARFAGRLVLVPSPADSVVISIVHGVINGDGDWAMDVGYRVSGCQVDWDRVVDIADRRGLVPPVLSGLTYVKTLGVDIPQSILDRLHETRPTPGECLKYLADTLSHKFWVDTPGRGDLAYRLKKRLGNALLFRLRNWADQIANALLPRDRYQYRGAVWNSIGVELAREEIENLGSGLHQTQKAMMAARTTADSSPAR